MENHSYESRARMAGYSLIAGVDEAGRGPLAGPVVAAAVILPEGIVLKGVRDSKKMTKESREQAFKLIKREAIDVSIAVVGPGDIDRINILQAARKAMARAINSLHESPDYVFIDGTYNLDLPLPQCCLIKGDENCLSISAASVLAKVYRDRIMSAYNDLYPQYGFLSNKGYGTTEHRDALIKHGPCPIHRFTFKGVLV